MENVSSLYICDGHRDCQDGFDELNCTCYHNKDEIKGGYFCSRHCSRKKECLCSVLYHNTMNKGCKTHVTDKHLESDHAVDKATVQCRNLTIKISRRAVNDLVFDCPNELSDEPELLSSSMTSQCPQPDMVPCYPGHSRCFSQKEQCLYYLTKGTQFLMYC